MSAGLAAPGQWPRQPEGLPGFGPYNQGLPYFSLRASYYGAQYNAVQPPAWQAQVPPDIRACLSFWHDHLFLRRTYSIWSTWVVLSLEELSNLPC